jgi:hypothetical protein
MLDFEGLQSFYLFAKLKIIDIPDVQTCNRSYFFERLDMSKIPGVARKS